MSVLHFLNYSVGNAGTGKSQVWKTLFRTFMNLRKKPVYNDLNPKVEILTVV